MLKDPILQAKELAGCNGSEEALDLFIKIFNIEELVTKQQEMKAAELKPVYVHSCKACLSFISGDIVYDGNFDDTSARINSGSVCTICVAIFY